MTRDNNTANQSDASAVILSTFAGIAQLLVFVLGTIGQNVFLDKIFTLSELIPIVTLISFIFSLCLIGSFSYLKNKPFGFNNKTTFKPLLWLKSLFFVSNNSPIFVKKNYQNLILMILIILVISIIIFLLSTGQYLTGEGIFNNRYLAYFQFLSFFAFNSLSTFVLYFWLSHETERRQQFKPEDFNTNLINTLHNNGYINIKFKKNKTDPQLGNVLLVEMEINNSS